MNILFYTTNEVAPHNTEVLKELLLILQMH